MSQIEKWMDEWLAKKEQKAWETFKKNTNFDKRGLPEDLEKLIKDIFIIGYQTGGVEEQNEIKTMAKVDPVGFYNWLKE